MLQEEYCRVLCQVDLKTKDVADFKQVRNCVPPAVAVSSLFTSIYVHFCAQAIQRQYHHNWIIDNLPAASILDTDQYVSTQYVGYPIGEERRCSPLLLLFSVYISQVYVCEHPVRGLPHR